MSHNRLATADITRKLETTTVTNPPFKEQKSERSELEDTDYEAEESTSAQVSSTAQETYSPVVSSLPPLPKEIVDLSIPSENTKLRRDLADLRRKHNELEREYKSAIEAKDEAEKQLKKERKESDKKFSKVKRIQKELLEKINIFLKSGKLSQKQKTSVQEWEQVIAETINELTH